MPKPSRLYALLDVPFDADAEMLRRARDRALLSWRSPARLRQIGDAYDVLSDPARRAAYDEFGDVAIRPGFDVEAERLRRVSGKASEVARKRAALATPIGVASTKWDLDIVVSRGIAKRGGRKSVSMVRPLPCPKCGGTGRKDRKCGTCGGALKVSAKRLDPCVPCHRLGVTGALVSCRRCRGGGGTVLRPCRRCGGAGVVVKHSDCAHCGGLGLHVERYDKPCPSCATSGLAPCARCDGAKTIGRRVRFMLRTPPDVVTGSVYRYAGAGFGADLLVRMTVPEARVVKRRRRRWW